MTEKAFAIIMITVFVLLFTGLYFLSLRKEPNLFYKKVKNPVQANDLVAGQIYYLNGWQMIEFVEVKDAKYIFKKMDNITENIFESNLAYISSEPEEDDND